MSLLGCCPQCGAQFDDPQVSCADRFAELLALDHSRTEPWGSRHGLAFSVFALQHPRDYPEAVRHGAWRMLYRVYVQGVDRQTVAAEMRAEQRSAVRAADVPPYPRAVLSAFPTTIADLGAFDATVYPERLDAWCRETLTALGA